MRGIHGVRYEAVSLRVEESKRHREVFPFGSLSDLDDLTGDEPVAITGMAVGPAFVSGLLKAFKWEINARAGALDREAFEYFATTLVPSIAKLAEAGGRADQAVYELAERVAALGVSGTKMAEAFAKALGLAKKSPQELAAWVLERDLGGASYLRGLLASVHYGRFAEVLVAAGLAAPCGDGSYLPLGSDETSAEG